MSSMIFDKFSSFGIGEDSTFSTAWFSISSSKICSNMSLSVSSIFLETSKFETFSESSETFMFSILSKLFSKYIGLDVEVEKLEYSLYISSSIVENVVLW